MLVKFEERRNGTRDMINELLNERQELLVSLCEIAELGPDPLIQTDQSSENNILSEFCQILIDYIALGHFEIFDRIMKEEERRNDVLKSISSIYLKVAFTTETILDFNDKYEETNSHSSEDLNTDLSKLGETLAARFELEDNLIEALIPAATIVNLQEYRKAA
ncbi:MAG: sigma D regulator [Methylococcales bacterium]|jgi:regulator of sigma D|nr:sigma D regulator [Methylococcales bacterium]